jgi:pyruvate kinase
VTWGKDDGIPVKTKREEKLGRLAQDLEDILATAGAFEERYQAQLEEVHPDQVRSALNLLHYLALRQRDISDLQSELGMLGLSGLGHAEAHVLANVHAVLQALRQMRGEDAKLPKSPVTFKQGRKLVRKHTSALLGKKLKGSSIRIMVTLPADAADDYDLVHGMLVAGMNCARINCSQGGPAEWARMVTNIERARKATGRGCRIFMDLSGPKVRTGSMVPGPRVLRVHPDKDIRGRVVAPVKLTLRPVTDGAEAPKGKGVIPVSSDLFAQLAPGDRIRFVDTRDRKGEFQVVSVDGTKARVLCPSTVYLEPGLSLSLEREGGAVKAYGSVGTLPALEEVIVLRVGDTLIIHKDPRPGEPSRAAADGTPARPAHTACSLPDLLDDVRVGEPLLLDDGKIHCVIRQVTPEGIVAEVTYAKPDGTRLKANKGINLPRSSLRISGLTNKDREDLRFVAAHADGVNVSFVNHPDDVEDLLDEMESVGGQHLGLILKIETRQGFLNLPGILLASMEWPRVGVMIARGDLAVEAGWAHLAQVQEEILWVCEAAHVPVVWATQVLERLAKKGLPTRSEISDVVMAERAECVMLNKGPYITETIRTLDRILKSMQSYQQKKATLMPALTLEEPDPLEVGRTVGTREGRGWIRSI